MKKFHGIKKRFFDLDRFMMSILLSLMALITFVEVAARYLFHAPLAHIGEFVPNLFVWTTFLGVAVAEKDKAHLGISFFELPSPASQKLYRGIGLIGTGLFYLTLGIYGSLFTYQAFTRGERTPFGVPSWIFSLAIPTCGILVFLRLIFSRYPGRNA